MFQKRNLRTSIAALGALLLVSGANAAAVDVSAVTTDMTAQLTPIAAVGAGVLLIVVAVKAFKWVRSAMS